MATHHAAPSEVVDLETWAQDLPKDHAKAIVKTQDMELARLVFRAGEEFKSHKVSGPIVVHCISCSLGNYCICCRMSCIRSAR
jgi:hypothetical protein